MMLCLELAEKLSFNHGTGYFPGTDIDRLIALALHQDLGREETAGILLLLPRARLGTAVAQKVGWPCASTSL